MLKDFKKNISLADYSTYKIGGKARYFFDAESKQDLVEAVKTAKENRLPFFILAGGSNVLFSDKGFKGLVIRIRFKSVEIKNNEIYAEAGAGLNDLVRVSSGNDLSGFEWAVGIPGTLGGAIFGNAQAFGFRISQNIKSVEALDTNTLKVKKFSNEQCRFKAKNSIFKSKGNLVILSAVLRLKKGNQKEIKEAIKEHLNYRKNNHPLKYPSCGSVFVNPEIKIKNKKLLKKFPELVSFNEKGFIHAGYLIDKSGLRGKKIGNAQISEQHANFIVNLGGAKSKDVVKLINLIKKKVKNIFKITLKEEIRLIHS